MTIKSCTITTLSIMALLLAGAAWAQDLRSVPKGLPAPRPPSTSAPLLRTWRPRPPVRTFLPQHTYKNRTYYGSRSWRQGKWHHERRGGRYGWWWNTGGIAYFYSAPSEGPPDYVSDVSEPDETGQAAEPAPPAEPQRAYLYQPGDINGVPYDTLEACWEAQKKAGKGICVLK